MGESSIILSLIFSVLYKIMEIRKITDPSSDNFLQAWSIYESAFSDDERRKLCSQIRAMANKLYSFDAIYENNSIVGILADWDLGEFSFIEHLAIRDDLRSCGLGSRLLQDYLEKHGKRVVLEIESPEDDCAKRRIHFYERLGFKLYRNGYKQPAYGNGEDIPMLLMRYPDPITESEYPAIRDRIHAVVYESDK